MKKRTVTYIDSALIEVQTSEIAMPKKIIATGFLIKETSEYITLAREIVGDEYRGQISIPKVSII